jgi:chromate transporter
MDRHEASLENPPLPPRASVPFSEAVKVWAKIAALSFGGPAGQIAVMHRVLVEEKNWISEGRFLHALNYCMLLPGPEAQQLATYIGWLLHRTAGGLVAGSLFILPGFLSVLALSMLYGSYHDQAVVLALFFGLKAAVLAVVVEAVHRIGKRALKNNFMLGLAISAFVAIFFFAVPFPAIVIGAGAIGFAGVKVWPELFLSETDQGETTQADTAVITDAMATHTVPSLGRSLRILGVFLPLWGGPLLALAWWLGDSHVLVSEGIFFSKAAVVTFGGAYSVLAYIAQQAVDVYGWLGPGEMLDGLGLAETTPGPLIMVVQFVGFLGAYRNPAPFDPLTAGILGSLVTVWVTFVPCFLWVFLGAPSIERLRGNRSVSSALAAITAAVVGVILNLAVWFGLHVAFGVVEESSLFGLRVLVPDLTTANFGSIAISAGAFVALFRLGWGMIQTLATCTLVGAVWFFLTQAA